MKPLDLTKPVQTRDGRKARIICTDLNHPAYSVCALIDFSGSEKPETFTKGGRFCGNDPHPFDLINVPERINRTYWVNVYPLGVCDTACIHDTKDEADRTAVIPRRLACVKITIDCEEGEGL